MRLKTFEAYETIQPISVGCRTRQKTGHTCLGKSLQLPEPPQAYAIWYRRDHFVTWFIKKKQEGVGDVSISGYRKRKRRGSNLLELYKRLKQNKMNVNKSSF